MKKIEPGQQNSTKQNSQKRSTRRALLGGLTPRQFLKEYWQKKPLLIRGALPAFQGLLSPDELAGLACEEQVQSRLVSYLRGKWQLEQGHFDEARFSQLPEKNWTLLVQGVNQHLPEAAALLQSFDFIPHARLDDLMVSYAPDGGSVGPHVDSYDVFLLQGQGQRLWRISEQHDLTLVEGAPLCILANFVGEQEWLLNPGDMLYLPPQLAHWGIAVGNCMTYSIGFRAPGTQELASEFLGYLQERLAEIPLEFDRRYADPDLKLQKHPARIARPMVKRVGELLGRIRWQDEDVAAFLGAYLTEPKVYVMFEPPRAISLEKFQLRLYRQGMCLCLQSLALFDDHYFFINGERLGMPSACEPVLMRLADRRVLDADYLSGFLAANTHEVGQTLVSLLYGWYRDGYVRFVA